MNNFVFVLVVEHRDIEGVIRVDNCISIDSIDQYSHHDNHRRMMLYDRQDIHYSHKNRLDTAVNSNLSVLDTIRGCIRCRTSTVCLGEECSMHLPSALTLKKSMSMLELLMLECMRDKFELISQPRIRRTLVRYDI
jgi:hypothetical protein